MLLYAITGDFTPVIVALGTIITVLATAVGWGIRQLFTGRLVPRSHVEDVRQDRRERVSEIANERDTWRATVETQQGTIQTLVGQMDQLLSQFALFNQVLSALRDRAER
jgi:hypothetical protein